MKRGLKKRVKAGLRKEAAALAAAPAPLNRKEIAANIQKAVGLYYRGKNRAVLPELGLCRGGRLRADLFVLAMNGHAVVVEIKSSVADFRTDKKMHKYLPFCNQAYLAVTKKVYAKIKEDIHPSFGVFVMCPEGKSIVKVKKSRKREIAQDVIFNLAMRAVFRVMPSSTRKNKAL